MFAVTQREVADILGLSPQAISAWERGRVSPDVEQLETIAKHYGFPVELFMIEHGILRGIDHVTLKYRPDPQMARQIEERSHPYTADVTAPLYGSIAAGKPIEEQPVTNRLWVPPDLLEHHPRAFYLKVDGESMNKLYPNGSYALVDPDSEPFSGDVAALNVNGHNATIKRVLLGSSSITLVPESHDDSFSDEIFDQTRPDTVTVTLIGKVIWHLVPYDALVRL